MTTAVAARRVALVVDARPWARVGGLAMRNAVLASALGALVDLGVVPVEETDDFTALARVRAELDLVRPDVTVFSGSAMANLAVRLEDSLRSTRVVYDAHNVEGNLLEALCQTAKLSGDPAFRARYPDSRVMRMRQTERAMLKIACAVWAVSEQDARVFHDLGARHVEVVPNVVDPMQYAGLVGGRGGRVLFVGRLDYLPNVFAVHRLCSEIVPLLRRRGLGLNLTVAGANPRRSVVEECRGCRADLVADPAEADLRSLWPGSVLALPMGPGGGSRVKMLQAFAAGVPVVSTRLAADGLEAHPSVHFWLAEGNEQFARSIESIVRDGPNERMVEASRELVRRRYSIDALRARLTDALRALAHPGRAS